MTTTLTKRSFVLGAASSMAAPLAWGCTASSAPAATQAALPALGDAAGVQHWHAYLHQAFALQAGGVQHQLVLSRVGQLPAAAGLQQFVLGFESATADPLPSGTYQVQHANGQAATLYLGDAGRSATRRQLRAEFSLLTTRV